MLGAGIGGGSDGGQRAGQRTMQKATKSPNSALPQCRWQRECWATRSGRDQQRVRQGDTSRVCASDGPAIRGVWSARRGLAPIWLESRSLREVREAG